MSSSDIDARLRAIGRDRKWLAAATGYTYFSLRDCLAPQGKGVSPRMAAAIEQALAREENLRPLAMEEFSQADKKAIAAKAAEEGFPSSSAWVVAKIRVLLAMMAAKPKK
jgi:hypothetical protein